MNDVDPYTHTLISHPNPRQRYSWPVVLVVAVLLVGSSLYSVIQLLVAAPADFPIGEQLEIPAGSNVRTIATQLKDEGYIRSTTAFTGLAWQQGLARELKAGRYVFSEAKTVSDLLTRLTNGDYTSDLVRLTHIEGRRVEQLADSAAAVLVNFDRSEFIALATPLEGRLFPDTYYIPDTFTAPQLVTLLETQFAQVTAALAEDIADHWLSLDEIIILASILEREANSVESKRTVSGILQNRLAIQMPLQADATLEYILEKPLSELTPDDLQIDTPYNTYLYNGLPPTPIGNPGQTAIEAVLHPNETDYFFYITGRDGNFYYAEDFDTHRQNIQRHLRL